MVERALSGEPDEGGLCRICQKPLVDGALRCSHCGAVHGEGFRCPHCRAAADVEALANGRLRCKACGGPRILLDGGKATLSGNERPALQQARRAITRSGLWKALGAGLGAFGALSLLIAITVVAFTSPGVILGTLGLALSSLPLLFAFGAYRRGVSYGKERDEAWRAAELSAVKDLAQQSSGELTAAALGKALGIEEVRAELLLAELSLEDHVARRVTDSGELAYSARPRVRLTEPLTEAMAPALETEAAAETETETAPAEARAEKESS
jgi:hypothetical protein